MNCLTLRRNQELLEARYELDALTPERVLPCCLADVARLPIKTATGLRKVADLFTLEDGSREQLCFSGDLSRADRVAANMSSGKLVIDGSVGHLVAAGLRGGQVVVNGDAGNFAAAGMRAGVVEIKGSVGESAAAAEPTKERGMRGGTLIVRQHAGPWLGARMRRGLVIVQGDVAAGCASCMIAGTMVLAGKVELPLGFSMARGSLLLLGSGEEPLNLDLAGFTTPERCDLSFLTLLLAEIEPWLPNENLLPATRIGQRWWRCVGDRAQGGYGEVFIRETVTPPVDF